MLSFVSDQRAISDEEATACDLASLQASDNKGTSTLLETSFIQCILCNATLLSISFVGVSIWEDGVLWFSICFVAGVPLFPPSTPLSGIAYW